MHVVRDDRLVLVLDVFDVHARFFLREHEPVAVVVVADVLVVQVGIDALERRALRLVPVIDHQHLAVGILRRHHQDDAVVEDLAGLRIGGGRQAVDDVDDRLAVADFGRVNRGVDEIERLALGSEFLRFGLRSTTRIGEAPIDLDEPIEFRQVLGRTDPQQRIAVPHRRLAELLVLDAVGLLREQLEVVEDLWIARQLSVRADLESEILIRVRNGLLCRHPAG
jgi:hypothetical protein